MDILSNNNSEANQKKFVCTVCKSKFKTASSLKQHSIAKNHNASTCPKCGKTFLSKLALKNHMSDKHQNKKKNKKKVGNNSINKTSAIKQEIRQLEEKKNIIKKEIENLEKYRLIILDENQSRSDDDIFNEINTINIETKYLDSDFNWYKKLDLVANPFPTINGLLDIEEIFYDSIVLKTPIFTKYLEVIESAPNELTNKSIIIYGEYGCGKSTLFDYLGYYLLKKNILPINIILDAEPSLPKLHESFQTAIFNELVEHLGDLNFNQRNSFYKKDRDSILELFRQTVNSTPYKAFIIFLDGLHKSEDNKEIPLKFLIELQNIIEFFNRKKIKLGIFVSGSNDWKTSMKYGSKVSGSFYTMDKIPEITPQQAYDMLQMRFETFSNDNSKDIEYFSLNDMDVLINTIKKRPTSEVSFRVFINEFLNTGFIINDSIKFNINLEKDFLQTISDELNKNPELRIFLTNIKEHFSKNQDSYQLLTLILSDLYEKRYFFEKDRYIIQNKPFIDLLVKNNMLLIRKDQKKNLIIYSLKDSVFNSFNSIEKKIRLFPKYYLNIYFSHEKEKVKEDAEYLKLLDTLNRIKSSSSMYKDKIEKIIKLYENDYIPFIQVLEDSMGSPRIEIEKKIILKMENLLIPLLNLIIDLSNENFKIKEKEDIYQLFRYSWLDNEELTFFFKEREKNLKKILKSKLEKGKFFKSFQDAFEHMVWKLGKHITYNTTLIVGSKDLTNHDKRELNKARALYNVPQYLQSIRTYSDLIEIKLRNFIYNILKIKYGDNWQSLIPSILMKKIKKNQDRDLTHFGKYLTNDNILCYLSRGEYHPLILEKYLWNNCYKFIFGDMNRQLILDLQTISTLANLEKHNRDEENLQEISYFIPQNLEKIKKVLEYINQSYRQIISPDVVFMEDNKNKLFFSYTNNNDKKKLFPVKINKNEKEEFEKNLNLVINKSGYKENYINLEDQSSLHKTFSLDYRQIIGLFAYYIKQGKLKIDDYFGSNVLLKWRK